MLLVHLVISAVPETRCSRIPELQGKNVWSATMHEPQMNPGLQIHILQQLWKDVT
jgi:hypothetical protein